MSHTLPASEQPRILGLPLEIRLEFYAHCSVFALLQFSHTCQQIRKEINSRPGLIRSTYGYGDGILCRKEAFIRYNHESCRRTRQVGHWKRGCFAHTNCAFSFSHGVYYRHGRFRERAEKLGLIDHEDNVSTNLDFDLKKLSIYNVRYLANEEEIKMLKSLRPIIEEYCGSSWRPYEFMFYICPNCQFVGSYEEFNPYTNDIIDVAAREEYEDGAEYCGNCLYF
ncbi:hypothetical protein BJ508DRAFT_321997 [Ascobolus immersus RN42]|uniref:F-box domain-containing protein n=1 Tax=Ascobolus immersus RN42 TaxID=1160509 RepID=A0A3N4INP6_ASCIM|nr:hypothetical protein BJ508DRAFT_321997 [Ascobolus immersus RN42]